MKAPKRAYALLLLASAFAAGAVDAAPVAGVQTPVADAETRQVALAVRAQADGRIRSFYQRRGYWPLWVKNGALIPEAKQLLSYIATADIDGLDPDRYKPERVARAMDEARDGSTEALAAAELRLSEAFADYVRDVRKPRSVKMTYLDAELEPGKMRDDEVLRTAALAKDFGAYVRAMGWMSPLYVSRREALAKLVKAGGDPAKRGALRLNLDRARLLPGPWVRHVVVDAASARLWYYADGKEQGAMKVVVGAPETQTPMLAGMVRYAILNPYWNIPDYLVAKRIAPKMLAGASLGKLGYEALSNWSADPQPIDASTIDWQAVKDGRAEIRVRQLPGPGNAMGRVKFMFPNDLGIYLHDTPERKLFAKADRHYSNGCIRLEDAPRLGRWFFGKPIAARGKEPEQNVPLPEPVPVYLTYLTAAPGKSGVAILNDVYGRDERGKLAKR